MMPKILVVDEDTSYRINLCEALNRNNYKTLHTGSGQVALRIMEEREPTLVLLGWLLEDISGIQVLKSIRAQERTKLLPVILVTSMESEENRITGFRTGASDYVVKPFLMGELLCRIRLQLQVYDRLVHFSSSVLRAGDFTIDLENYVVKHKGKKIDVTMKEYELLKVFIERRGQTVSRETLLNQVWNYSYFGETRTLDVHIRHLRQKIEADDKKPRIIETVRGIGYKFNP